MPSLFDGGGYGFFKDNGFFYCSSFNLIHHSLSNYNQSKHEKSREQMRHGIIYVTEGIRKRGQCFYGGNRRRGTETKRGRKVLTYRRTINVINSY